MQVEPPFSFMIFLLRSAYALAHIPMRGIVPCEHDGEADRARYYQPGTFSSVSRPPFRLCGIIHAVVL